MGRRDFQLGRGRRRCIHQAPFFWESFTHQLLFVDTREVPGRGQVVVEEENDCFRLMEQREEEEKSRNAGGQVISDKCGDQSLVGSVPTCHVCINDQHVIHGTTTVLLCKTPFDLYQS